VEEQPQPSSPTAAAPPEAGSRKRGFLVVFVIVPVVFLVVLFAPRVGIGPLVPHTVARAMIGLEHPQFQMDPEEGALLAQSAWFASGRRIYRPLTDYPYIVGTYPPVYLWLSSAFSDDSETFYRGRVLSALACAGIAMLMVLIVGWRTRNVVLGAFAAALFLVSYPAFRWVPYFRVDMLAIFLSMAGLALATLLWRSWPVLVSTIVLFTLALFTKQTEVAAPAAVCVALIVRERKRGLIYTGALAAAVLAAFLVAVALTSGQFVEHTIYYNMNEFVWGDVRAWARHAWTFYRWLIVAAATALALEAWLASRRPGAVREMTGNPLLWFAVFSLMNFIAVGKAGSAENYLLVPLGAIALYTCDATGRFVRVMTARNLAAAGVLTVLLILHGWWINRLAPVMLSPAQNPTARDFANASRVAQIVRESDSSWSELAIYNWLAGRSPSYQPFIMNELDRQGKADASAFISDLAAGRFETVVTCYDVASGEYTNVYSPPMLEVLRDRFNESERLPGSYWNYFVYRYGTPGQQP
jgi:hypothetical protein